MPAYDAFDMLVLRFKIMVDFGVLCMHDRPLDVFLPGLVLVRVLKPDSFTQVWPVEKKKRRPGKGRGRGGRHGGGRARGRGGARGGRASPSVPGPFSRGRPARCEL